MAQSLFLEWLSHSSLNGSVTLPGSYELYQKDGVVVGTGCHGFYNLEVSAVVQPWIWGAGAPEGLWLRRPLCGGGPASGCHEVVEDEGYAGVEAGDVEGSGIVGVYDGMVVGHQGQMDRLYGGMSIFCRYRRRASAGCMLPAYVSPSVAMMKHSTSITTTDY